MLKWVASGCLVVIVVVGVVMYAGYRKIQSVAAAGPAVTVAINGTPERVYAAMSNADSLAQWFSIGTTLRTTKSGALSIGDSVFVIARRDSAPTTAWIVDTLVPNRIVAMRWVILANGMAFSRRRDSISVVGDSTYVTSTISSMASDSLAAARARANGVTGGVMQMGATMGIASARMQAEMDLRRLKAYIEGVRPSRP